MIYRYQKHTDEFTTYALVMPAGEDGQAIGTDLCEVAGVTYAHIPDGVALPAQPSQITVEPVTLTADLTAAIKAASPHVALINQRVAEQIADHYSMADEIKLLRTAPSPEFEAYNAHAEACRAWGRAEKAKLGL